MPKKVAQKNCPNQILAKNTKKKFWRPGNANSKAIEAGYFQKKNREEQLSKVAQEKWPKICPKKKAQKKSPKNMSKKKMPDRIAPKLCASVMVNERMAKTNARGHWPLQSFSISWPKKLDSLEHVSFLWHFIWAN